MRIDFMTRTGKLVGGLFVGLMLTAAAINLAALAINLWIVVPKLNESVEEVKQTLAISQVLQQEQMQQGVMARRLQKIIDDAEKKQKDREAKDKTKDKQL